jgi:hypothetical protein
VTDQLIGQRRESVKLGISIPILDRYVITLNIAEFTELPPE